jgi:hypothetical protein
MVIKPEGPRPLGRPDSRWEDNIKIDIKLERGRVCICVVWLRIGTKSGPP